MRSLQQVILAFALTFTFAFAREYCRSKGAPCGAGSRTACCGGQGLKCLSTPSGNKCLVTSPVSPERAIPVWCEGDHIGYCPPGLGKCGYVEGAGYYCVHG